MRELEVEPFAVSLQSVLSSLITKSSRITNEGFFALAALSSNHSGQFIVLEVKNLM